MISRAESNRRSFNMTAPKPGPLSLVPFVSVDDMMGIANEIGVQRFLGELAGYIEVDFRRWESFDKTPRVAAHSREGVIELMPTSDGVVYGFKYVNGQPPSIVIGTVDKFAQISWDDRVGRL